MASIVLHCPNCQQPYQMSPEQITKYAGRWITCRRCKQPFAFDAAMDAAARAAGQADAAEEHSDTEAADASAAGADHEAHATAASYAAPVAVQPPPPPARSAAPAGAAAFPPHPPAPPPAAAPQFRAPAPASHASPPSPALAASPPSHYAPQGLVPPSTPAVGYGPAAVPLAGSGQPSSTGPAQAPSTGSDGAPAGFADFFVFRRMALPAVLPVAFWLGIAWCLFNGLRLFCGLFIVYGFEPLHAKARSSTEFSHFQFTGIADRVFSFNGISSLVEILFWLVLGPLFWRGFCELILAASRLMGSARR